MTRRLLLSYLVLALVVLVALEAPLAVLEASRARSAMVAQAERDATSLALVTAEDVEHGRVTEVNTIVHQYRVRTGGEVAVVGASGSVIAASGVGTVEDATHDQNAMVGGALSGQSAGALISERGRALAAAAVPVLVDGRARGAVLLEISAGSMYARDHEFWLFLGAFAVGVLGLTELVGVLLARSVSKPLANLELAVDKLGKGHLGARASTTEGPEEVRSLGLQFNRMAGRLSELMEAQNRFVADASHQLRSPLTALRLRLENLELMLEPSLADDVAAATGEVQRLSRLVDGLLSLTRAGSDQPQRHPVDVGMVIAERCSAWTALAEERQVSLEGGERVAAGPLAELVPGDLDQVLDNLLANALDACPAGSHVRIEVVPVAPDRSEVHVIDDGPGLGPEERVRAFERFWQGRDRRGTETAGGGGAGLGLAIVRQLAERNGGEVELRQAGEHGLDAVVTLPVVGIAVGPGPPPPVPAERQANSGSLP